jgi:Flp pilus assembly protein TadD
MTGHSKQAAELHQLGVAALQQGRLDAAVDLIQRAIAMSPDYAEAYGNLGNILTAQGKIHEAIAAYQKVIAINPKLPEAHSNLGNALRENGQLTEAIAACRQAIALQPRFAKAHGNLANALKEQGKFDEAVAAYHHAISLNPNSPETHYNLSFALLAKGEFQQGWEEYEWRWKCRDFPSARQNFSQPQWDGSPLNDRTILLHTEQGFGDAIQFVRYLPLVAQRGGKIILQCQMELQRLFQTIPGNGQIITQGQTLPAFDLHCPLLTLPRLFGTTLATIPKSIPYLHADKTESQKWQHRLASHAPMLKVGLAWAGSTRHKNDRNRSINPATLALLGNIPGIHFFSLQKENPTPKNQNPPAGMELIDWTHELKDFADTAALIANLDLIITADTATAHLAGAIGKPVWTLLPFIPDWRWLLDRTDTPWYPSMQLFRQSTPGDWDEVITRVAGALSLFMKNRD